MMEMPVTVETQPVSSAEIGFSEIKGVRPL